VDIVLLKESDFGECYSRERVQEQTCMTIAWSVSKLFAAGCIRESGVE
jgi:hypothetical protein